MQKGGNNINYTYIPSIDSKSAYTVAYEYSFENTMTKAVAINLKSIDTTGVTVSYAYSDSKLDLSSDIESSTTFTLQQLPNKGDEVYIYVLVSPTNASIPTTFTTSIVWYYGLPKIIQIPNNIDGSIATQTIVDGQKVDNNELIKLTTPSGYYFDAYYKDKEYKNPIINPTEVGKNVYARFANLPEDYLEFDGSDYFIKLGTSSLPNKTIVPAIYKGNKVKYIEDVATSTEAPFYQKPTTEVVLPYTITSIGDYAFSDNISLITLNLDSCINLTTIGSHAFFKCTSLKDFTMPRGITEIWTHAFYGCSSLVELDLSHCIGLESIHSYAFQACSSITLIGLPTSIKSIGEYVFRECTVLKEVDLSNCTNLNKIAKGLFYGDTSLQKVQLPSSLITLDIGVFNLCTALISIDLTNCIQLNAIGTYAFESCTSLTTVLLPDSVTTLGGGVFEDTSVREIVMPSNLTTVEAYTFMNDTNLISADLSKCTKLTTISKSMFYNCPRLVTVKLPNNITTIGETAFSAGWSLSSINIPSNLTNIGTKAFYGCKSITSITLPSTLTSIGDEAFNGCAALAEIYNLSSLTLTSGSNNNGMVAYYTNATNIYSSTSVKSVIETIGNIIYYKQSSSEYVALAPVNRFGLESLKLDSRTIKINCYAFQYCPNLVSVDLSNCTRLYEISTYGFHNCAKLSIVKLPSALTSVGTDAFYANEALVTIYNYSSLVLTAGSTDYGYVAYYAKNIY